MFNDYILKLILKFIFKSMIDMKKGNEEAKITLPTTLPTHENKPVWKREHEQSKIIYLIRKENKYTLYSNLPDKNISADIVGYFDNPRGEEIAKIWAKCLNSHVSN